MIKRSDAGIPVDYDSDHYTYSDQLKELQILNIHESDSSDDLADDASNSHHSFPSNYPNDHDKAFDSDHSNHSRSFTPLVFDLSDSERNIEHSMTDSMFEHNRSHKIYQKEDKYDRMEPLIFGVQPPRSNKLKSNKLKSKKLSPSPPQSNGHGHDVNGTSNGSSSNGSPQQRRNSLIPQQSHSNGTSTSPLLTNEAITKQDYNNTHFDDYKLNTNTNSIHSNSSHCELEIKDATKRVNDLMNDIWWLLDKDNELKKYKDNDDNDNYRNDILVLFESFNLMNNNGDKICYTFCKLFGPQIVDFALKQSLNFRNKQEWKLAIKAYNVIIRYSKILKLNDKLYEYYLNRSQCYFKMGEYQLSLFDAEQSYKINPLFEKGYIMHGKILMTLYQYQDAKQIYIDGYRLNGKYKKQLNNGIQIASKELKMSEKSKKIDFIHIWSETVDDDDDEKYLKDKKSMTHQMRREIDTECNKWNKIINIKDSKTIYIEAMKPCKDIRNCECTKRVMFLMQVYIKWSERYIPYMSLNECMDKICGNSYYYYLRDRNSDKSIDSFLLMNDYIHIIDKHINIGVGDNDINWKYLTKQLGICENNSCKIFKRHFRNKNICITSIKERAKKYLGYIDSDYVALIQLFDQIHCHITHCNPFCISNLYDSIFDIYIKGNADNDDETDIDDDNESYIEMSDISSISEHIEHIGSECDDDDNNKKRLKQKINREKLNYIKQYDTTAINNPCLHSKFISHIDNKLGMQFGVQFVYWSYFCNKTSIFCKPKYKTLKSELLNNNIYPINKYIWNDVLNKAKWIQISYKCQSEMKANDKGLENKKLEIPVGLKISLSHLIVLLLMSNYIELRNKFIEKACNLMIDDDDDIENVKYRNSEIGNFCKLLYESVLFYGSEMRRKQYFYHGIDHRLLFNNYHLSFKQPISTTSSLDTMHDILLQNLYKTKDCIILKWGLSDSYGCPYFNVSWISNNPYEQECIFFNVKLGLYDILHLDINYGDETKQILQSHYKYIQSLILFEKIIKGYFFSSNYDGKIRELYEKIIAKMIENFLHPTNAINAINNRSRSPSLSHSKSRKSESNSIFTKIVENVVNKIASKNNIDDEKNSNLEIPHYIQNLFRFYCENIDELWLNKSELSSLSDGLRVYFVDNNQSSNDIIIDSSNHDHYGSFLRMIETNHINEYKEKGSLFINFVDEYVWYIGKNTFNEFLSLKCNQSMVGPKIHVQISYDTKSNNNCNSDSDSDSDSDSHSDSNSDHPHFPNDESNDFIIFEPNCYRSLKFAPSFGAFGLNIKELPIYIEKIKFEYQVFCKEANYILIVPSGKKWYKKNDNVGFKSFKSSIVTSNITKEFSYRFTIKIIQIQKHKK